MVIRPSLSSHHRLRRGAIAAGLFILAAAAPASAQHRARLSADLADHIAAGSQSIDVIVHGDAATVDAIVTRYNVKVKHLASGGVLHVNAGQLSALQQDEAIDHLSGDILIKSSVDAVTAESIGADQVWAGAGELDPLTGRGVTVAVIDSGMDGKHSALKGRVLFTKDFTGGDGHDGYGHGTHVAAIIAGQAVKSTDAHGYRGIAPGAWLVNLRVLGDDGSGTASVYGGVDWAIAQRAYAGVINPPLGALVFSRSRRSAVAMVERAVRQHHRRRRRGISQTADGKRKMAASPPPPSPHAVRWAVDTHGTVQRSTTRGGVQPKGPRDTTDSEPDVVAPGTHIVSAESRFICRPTDIVAGTGAEPYAAVGTRGARCERRGGRCCWTNGRLTARGATAAGGDEHVPARPDRRRRRIIDVLAGGTDRNGR